MFYVLIVHPNGVEEHRLANQFLYDHNNNSVTFITYESGDRSDSFKVLIEDYDGIYIMNESGKTLRKFRPIK